MSHPTNDVSTSTSPHRSDVSAQEVTQGAAPGPPGPKQAVGAPPPLKEHNSGDSTNSSNSTLSRSSWSWSRSPSESSTGTESPPPDEYSNKPTAETPAAYRRPSVLVNGKRNAAQTSAALSRRAFAKRTAIQFQLLHPTSHAIVLNFALSPLTCKLQGSRLYAHADRFDPDSDDVEEDPLIFDSVRWSPGDGIEEERYDVYLFQSGRFSLDAVANDENIWAFSSLKWEKLGKFIFFDHIPFISTALQSLSWLAANRGAAGSDQLITNEPSYYHF